MSDKDNKNFNFDDFQRELSQAESYLRSSINKDNKNIVSEEEKKISIEETRKHDILQQLGRRPLGLSLNNNENNQELLYTTSRNDDRVHMLIKNRDIYNISPDSISGDNPNDNNEHIGKYTQQTDKERLINKLLAEHNSKSKPRTADEIIAASSLRNSLKLNEFDNDTYIETNNAFNYDNNSNPYSNKLMSTMRYTDDKKGWELNTNLETSLDNSVLSYNSDNDNPISDENNDFLQEETLFFASDLNNTMDSKKEAWGEKNIFLDDKTSKITEETIVNPNMNNNKKQSSILYQTTNIPNTKENPTNNSNNKFLKSRSELKREEENKFNATFDFKPTLVTNKDNKNNNENKKKISNFSNRIIEMNKSHEKSLLEREKQYRDMKELELIECTFKPQISKGADQILRSKASLVEDEQEQYSQRMINKEYASSGSRLHDDAEQRMIQKKYIEKKVKEARMSEYTFQPVINPNNSTNSAEHKPIHERIGDIQREKKKKLHDLRASHWDSQVDLTFTPKIDSKSKRIAELIKLGGKQSSQSNSNIRNSTDKIDLSNYGYSDISSGAAEAELVLNMQSDVATRLINEGRKIQHKKQMMMHEREREESLLMEPVIPSKGSQSMAKNNPRIAASFEERQTMHKQKMALNSANRLAKQQQEGSLWFKPEISIKTDIILEKARPNIVKETNYERASRMSKQEMEAIEKRRKLKESEIYDSMTFVPAVDPISRTLGRKADLQELVENNRGKLIKERIRNKVEKEIGELCTFKPEINEYKVNTNQSIDELYNNSHQPNGWIGMSDALGIDANVLEGYPRSSINLREPERMAKDIKLYLHEKEELRRSELVAREIEELKECTFAPDVVPYQPLNQDVPVIVRGLGRYLELKHLHVKQKEELTKRETEVFQVRNVEQFRRKDDGSTIVKPFIFSSSQPRKSRALKELEEEHEAELTFTPDVCRNYSRNGRYDNNKYEAKYEDYGYTISNSYQKQHLQQ